MNVYFKNHRYRWIVVQSSAFGRLVINAIIGSSHAVLDVVIDDEIQFLAREPIMLGENMINLIDKMLGSVRAELIIRDCRAITSLDGLPFGILDERCLETISELDYAVVHQHRRHDWKVRSQSVA